MSSSQGTHDCQTSRGTLVESLNNTSKSVYDFMIAQIIDGRLCSSLDVITDIVVYCRNETDDKPDFLLDFSIGETALNIKWQKTKKYERYGIVDMKGKWINPSQKYHRNFIKHGNLTVYVHGFLWTNIEVLLDMGYFINPFRIPTDVALKNLNSENEEFNICKFGKEQDVTITFLGKPRIKFTKAGLLAYKLINPHFFRFSSDSVRKKNVTPIEIIKTIKKIY